MCACYVLGTVVSGHALVGTLACYLGPLVATTPVGGGAPEPGSRVYYAVKVLDALVYVFLPQLMMLLLRLLQGRPLLHRMVGRSVLIGDCPWVAQSVEAFASKLFACSYAMTAVAFACANPADHLVHRHTHRVVREGCSRSRAPMAASRP